MPSWRHKKRKLNRFKRLSLEPHSSDNECAAMLSRRKLLAGDLEAGGYDGVMIERGDRQQPVDRFGDQCLVRWFDLNIRLDTPMADRFAARRVELRRRQSHAGIRHAERKDALHAPFAVA